MDIYLLIVIVLAILAISDLMVGVANDAVNFLNSAVGSKSAPYWVIMIIASIGVFVGAIFSGGMMEVARKGIFHPDQFYFSEIMIIFLAVMVTDVILLDVFNTFGMPTSTTVSLVFELLGAAVAVTIIKITMSESETILQMGRYINTEKAFAIISGILVSVILAFTSGAIIQYISRLIFSFNYQKTLKYFGSLWGSLAITAIIFFMLIVGVKGAPFLTPEIQKWITTHTWNIVIYSFIGCTIILQVLWWVFKVNIPKIIVLVGTFALAMAFASNDLVNFVGVPLAGLKSYQNFSAVPGADPGSFLMGSLAEPVKTQTIFLLLSGLIMVLTLWFSKKARTVISTTVDLSRQGKGDERFGSSVFSRAIVRSTINVNRSVTSVLPNTFLNWVNSRFQISKADKKKARSKEAASFDLIRASVNLVVASILIAMGTSLKLPLSTTYVTFMVAMGTSLSDRAWGRDSAVYRIQGVFLVIGGWFLTALIAFTVSFILANIIYWGGIISIAIILGLAIIFLYRTHVLHKSRETAKKEDEKEFDISEITSASHVFEKCQSHTLKTLSRVPDIFDKLITGLSNEDRLLLKDLNDDVKKFNKKTKKIKDNLTETVLNLQADQIDTGHFYVQSVDYLREIAHSISFIVTPSFEHIENNHTGLNKEQIEELAMLKNGIDQLFKEIILKIETSRYHDLDLVISHQHELLAQISEIRKNQVKRIKDKELQTRTSLLFLDIIAETKNMLLFSINLLKSQRDFILELAKK